MASKPKPVRFTEREREAQENVAVDRSLAMMAHLFGPEWVAECEAGIVEMETEMRMSDEADMIERLASLRVLRDEYQARAVAAEAQLATMREALTQMDTVCTDNEPDSCNHKLALKFVRDIALAALEAKP